MRGKHFRQGSKIIYREFSTGISTHLYCSGVDTCTRSHHVRLFPKKEFPRDEKTKKQYGYLIGLLSFKISKPQANKNRGNFR